MSELVRGERPALTKWEQYLRWTAALPLVVISLGFAALYIGKGLWGSAEYPYVANSVAKDLLLAGLAWLVVWDVRRWASVAVPLIVAAHVAMMILLVVTAIWGVEGVGHTWGGPLSATGFRWVWFGGDAMAVVAFSALHYMAVRTRYDLRYLTPSGFRALMALAEVLVLRKDREFAPAEVGVRVDHYLASFRAHDKNKVRMAFIALAFWPVLLLRPPFHVMSLDVRQDWVKRRFLDETRDWLVPEWLREIRRAVIRTAQQFCFFGYYGDERAAEKAGYLPFSRRTGTPFLLREVQQHRPGVTCMSPGDISGNDLSADIVVIGSGAAGAMLAYEFAARGREVLVLERGAHVEPTTFTENEAEQLSNLYADGALTLSKDFRFQVAQGMCVGGGTVVNNAVCFDLPDHVLDRWLELKAGIDPDRLADAFTHVRAFLDIGPLGPPARRSPGAEHLVAAIDRVHPGSFKVVDCNIVGCLGSGYCNIGCKFGKKLSALDRTLPLAQRSLPGTVDVLPDCRVEKIVRHGPTADGVLARLADGRRLTVRANTVVVSAGAIASSIIMQRSGLGDDKAGQGLSFNIASPVTLDFDADLHSERGAQMTHARYFEPANGNDGGYVLETWFNPIVTQSLFMPGWFEEHWDNMRRYRNMTCLGVVVGTESNGTVKATKVGVGVDLKYRPTPRDFIRLKNGVRLACKIGLEARARRAMPTTFRVIEITSERDLARIEEEIGDDADININTSHPQGGNPMSIDPKKGVVDNSFRVYGTQNVYVCDASVFPSSITVNPQLTVMALAVYAADEIAGPRPSGVQLVGSTSQGGAPGPGS
jgi:choline dehydrogenase-like flavoprotein